MHVKSILLSLLLAVAACGASGQDLCTGALCRHYVSCFGGSAQQCEDLFQCAKHTPDRCPHLADWDNCVNGCFAQPTCNTFATCVNGCPDPGCQ
jgi:hypothetical protein